MYTHKFKFNYFILLYFWKVRVIGLKLSVYTDDRYLSCKGPNVFQDNLPLQRCERRTSGIHLWKVCTLGSTVPLQ